MAGWSSYPNLNRKVFSEQLPKLRYFHLYFTGLTFVEFSIESAHGVVRSPAAGGLFGRFSGIEYGNIPADESIVLWRSFHVQRPSLGVTGKVQRLSA